jgi:hypothetical protein
VTEPRPIYRLDGSESASQIAFIQLSGPMGTRTWDARDDDLPSSHQLQLDRVDGAGTQWTLSLCAGPPDSGDHDIKWCPARQVTVEFTRGSKLDTSAASNALDAWAGNMRAAIEARRNRLTEEFIARLPESLDEERPVIDAAHVAFETVKKLDEEAIAEGSKVVIEAVATAIGTELCPGVGTVVGFFVGLLFSLCTEDSSGEAHLYASAASAMRDMKDRTARAHQMFTRQAAEASGRVDGFVGQVRNRIQQVTTRQSTPGQGSDNPDQWPPDYRPPEQHTLDRIAEWLQAPVCWNL